MALIARTPTVSWLNSSKAQASRCGPPNHGLGRPTASRLSRLASRLERSRATIGPTRILEEVLLTTSKIGSMALAMLCTASLAQAQVQAQTQTEQTLTLADATARALARNLDIRIDRETVNIAEAREVGAQGSYDFRLRADGTERYQLAPNVTLFSGAPPGDLAPWQNDFSRVGVAQPSVQERRDGHGVDVGLARHDEQLLHAVHAGVHHVARPAGPAAAFQGPRNRSGPHPAQDHRARHAEEPRHAAAAGPEHRRPRGAGYWSLVATRREVNVRRDSVTLARAAASRHAGPHRRAGRPRRSTSRSRRRKSSGVAATISRRRNRRCAPSAISSC